MRKLLILAVISMFAAVSSEAEDNITLTGYDELVFQAGEALQSVDFQNASSNSCFIRISLILQDGNILWQSDLLNPGDRVKSITLSEALHEGSYSATLAYECFALEDKSQLNGFNSILTIIAK